jgi:hypothetical protein
VSAKFPADVIQMVVKCLFGNEQSPYDGFWRPTPAPAMRRSPVLSWSISSLQPPNHVWPHEIVRLQAVAWEKFTEAVPFLLIFQLFPKKNGAIRRCRRRAAHGDNG